MAIPTKASDCVKCYYQAFVQNQYDHLGRVLALGVYLTTAIYLVVYHFLDLHLSPSWIAGLYACWVLGNIMLREPTFSAFTLLYDYHVRTRVCGIHWPKEKNVPIFFFTCAFLGIILWRCIESEEKEPYTWTIIGCIIGMLVVFRVTCYDSFKGLQAWETTHTNFKRLQLVKYNGKDIVVLFSSNANEFHISSKGVLRASELNAVTTNADLNDAQDFMQKQIVSNANHPWIKKHRAIIECITGTIKGFDPKTPWEWVKWPWKCFRMPGISMNAFAVYCLGIPLLFLFLEYRNQLLMRESNSAENYDCNSEWHSEPTIQNYWTKCTADSKDFFTKIGLLRCPYTVCLFYWIEAFLYSYQLLFIFLMWTFGIPIFYNLYEKVK